MDEWLLNCYDGDARAMRRQGRTFWRGGWTLIAIGAAPLIFLWQLADLRAGAVLRQLVNQMPSWLPAAALMALYAGFVLTAAGWYLAHRGKQLRSYF